MPLLNTSTSISRERGNAIVPRFVRGVESDLRRAGWIPGRRVDLSRWRLAMRGFTWHAAAEEFLREFGGLHVDSGGPGVDCWRESFEFDPELAVGEEDRFWAHSEKLGHTLFPLGEYGQGEFFLAIDENSTLYLVAASVLRLGPRDSALERLIMGVAPEGPGPPDYGTGQLGT
ncbi:SUKH-3 domain-containing protein [Plantactinospora sp. WMMB334]|uniref:SUKH-3 domain-containing protein n=1 Tax=Plantactinospora sp. WMMB334 TaxID=3404119 RepID=UPI003B94B431